MTQIEFRNIIKTSGGENREIRVIIEGVAPLGEKASESQWESYIRGREIGREALKRITKCYKER